MFRLFKHIFVAILLFGIVILVNFPFVIASSYQDVCATKFEYRGECIEFVFNDICVPWNTTNCAIKQISFSEHHCLIYNCSVSLLFKCLPHFIAFSLIGSIPSSQLNGLDSMASIQLAFPCSLI
jgi:hypothetical protein